MRILPGSDAEQRCSHSVPSSCGRSPSPLPPDTMLWKDKVLTATQTYLCPCPPRRCRLVEMRSLAGKSFPGHLVIASALLAIIRRRSRGRSDAIPDPVQEFAGGGSKKLKKKNRYGWTSLFLDGSRTVQFMSSKLDRKKAKRSNIQRQRKEAPQFCTG